MHSKSVKPICFCIGHIWKTVRVVPHEIRGDERHSRLRKDREFVTLSRECTTCGFALQIDE